MENKNIPAFSESVVEDFKLKYPHCLKVVEIYPDEDTEEPLKFLIKKPSKSLVYLLSSKEFDENIQKSSDAMIANCVLAGNMEILEDDAAVFSELVATISSLMKGARTELKKA